MTAKGAALLGTVFGFLAGAAAMYFYMKNSEEAEIIEFDPDKKKIEPPKEEKKEEPFDKGYHNAANDATVDYSDRIKKETYSQNYNETVETKKDQVEAERSNAPYAIQPDEFGELKGYSKFTLKYFKDGFLVDDKNEPLDYPEDIVGKDFMSHFGEYEDDTAYIRNDKIEADFEILFVDEEFINYLQNN